MTEEEKARNFAMNEMRYSDVEYDVPKSPIKIAEEAYLAGLHEGQSQLTEKDKQITTLSQNLDDAMSVENALKKRIEELEAQIEKMKCCNNCKYRYFMDWKSKCCFDMTKIRDIENPITCKCNKWKIEE